MPTSPARHIGIAIERSAEEVYAYLAEPMNYPNWAEGLGRDFEHVEGMTFRARTPMGQMRIVFSEPNRYGVLDHALIAPDGTTVHNPMRVMPNGSGAELVFTLFRRGMSEDELAHDLALITQDFARLKALLEA